MNYLLAKIKLLGILIILLPLSINPLKASHVLGGEITWECLPNGRYVFYAKVYRDCTGIPFSFNSRQLEIVGNPLPKSIGGADVTSITLLPDSSLWISTNFGDITPRVNGGVCDSTALLSCGNDDEGAVQMLPYYSLPISLVGTPPANGWKFYFVQACCRPNVTNLASAGTLMLRAELYPPTSQNSNPSNCYESSPEFLEQPDYLFCRGAGLTNQFAAFDRENDSLVYSLERTYNSPPISPQPVPYNPGYSPQNPTPDTSFDIRNIATNLNSRSGVVDFAVYNGSPITLDYLVCVKVEAYRDKQLISATYRELPIVMVDCQKLSNNQANQSPSIDLNGSSTFLELNVQAGDLVEFPITSTDLDSNGMNPQVIQLSLNGRQVAANLQSNNQCLNAPCAVLKNSSVVFNNDERKFVITDSASVSSTFSWQTACNHAGSNGDLKTYTFTLEAKDNYCPIPSVRHATVIINVHSAEKDSPTDLCGEENSQNNLDLFWKQGGIDSSTFISWRIYKRVNIGTFTFLDSISNRTTTSYSDITYNPNDTSDYRIAAFASGCGGNYLSKYSEVFSTKYLDSIVIDQNSRTLTTTTAGSYQWYNCSSASIIPEANSNNYTPPVGDSGLYALIIKRGACIDTSDCYYVSSIGLSEENLNNHFTIYPNPTNDVVFIKGSFHEIIRYQLFSLEGKLIEDGRINSRKRTLDMPSNAGIYLLKLEDHKGNLSHFKIIKK